jgi:hypothetical protein
MNDLEVRLCTLREIFTGPQESHSTLEVDDDGNSMEGHSESASAIADMIVSLEFNGSAISSDTTALRNAVRVALGGDFPADDLLLIGPASGLTGERLRVAGQRALAVKRLLLESNVPAENVAADAAAAPAMAEA